MLIQRTQKAPILRRHLFVNGFIIKIRPVIFAAMLLLVFSADLLSGGIHQDSPAFEDSAKEAVSRFNATAKTVLAPAYPYLAEHITARFGLADKQGTGIDIGGGPGDLVLELARCSPGFFWINADINPNLSGYLYQAALDRGCTSQIGFVCADVHELPFRDNYADVVVSRGSLQQWRDREQAFAEICRVLKPGGRAFIGRGFSENLPLETAKQIRVKQGGGPKYSPDDTARGLEEIMARLGIEGFRVIRPRTDQDQVNYGVWVVFQKPE